MENANAFIILFVISKKNLWNHLQSLPDWLSGDKERNEKQKKKKIDTVSILY